MKTKISLFFIYTLIAPFVSLSQVGIGTISPNASLEIQSSNQATPLNTDGILIPKIDEFPGSAPAAAQDGMLVYVTGAGSVAKGFYHWNQSITSWTAFTTGSASNDAWYEESTTTAPNDINDDIYTMGNVAIGKNTASYPIDIDSYALRGLNINLPDDGVDLDRNGLYINFEDDGDGNYTGFANNVSGMGNGNHIGIVNGFSRSFSALVTGILNFGWSSSFTGMDNRPYSISSTGVFKGVNNLFNGGATAGVYGTYNDFSTSGVSDFYGTYNEFNATGGGQMVGLRNMIKGGSGAGNQYAVFNTFQGFTSGHNVGVRNVFTILDGPSHTGVYNQMDGTGDGTIYGVQNYFTNTGNGIQYGVKTDIIGTGGGTKIALSSTIATSAGGVHYGLFSEVLKPTGYAGYFLGKVSIGTDASNNYILPASRGSGNQVMQSDGSGSLSWIDVPVDESTASNGLSESTNDIQLGGSLTQNTTITHGTFNMIHNLEGTGNFKVQDNGVDHFEVRNNGNTYIGGTSFWHQNDISGTQTASIGSLGDDGFFTVNANGSIQHFIAGEFDTVFNNLGLDVDFNIAGATDSNLFYLNAGTDRVGIGTNVPNTKLHIMGGVDASLANNTGYLVLGDLAGQNMVIDQNEIITRLNGANSTLFLNQAGGDVWAGGALVHSSDLRLKRDISELNYGLDEVLQLQPMQYYWKNRDNQKQKSLGLIAQDVQGIIKNIVHEANDEQKTLSISYTELIPVLVNAIKEQQSIINKQQDQIDELSILVRQLLNQTEKISLNTN